MLKKLRKDLRRRRLAVALAAVVALSAPAAPVSAAIGPQAFSDGQSHSITDNIVSGVSGSNGLQVGNPGTRATMTGWSVTSTATFGFAVYALGGGEISLTNVAVTSGGYGYGVHALDAGSTITMTGGSVTTIGMGNKGVSAENGGAISLNSTAVNISGSGGFGLYAIGVGSTITMTGGSVTTTVAYGRGAFAIGGGEISLTNAAVNTSGNNSHGLYAVNGTITMTGGSVTTTGSHGAYAESGAISLTNAAVNTSGNNSYGLYADNGTITTTGGSVTTTGPNSYALYAISSGTINATVTGQGIISGSAGLLYAGSGGAVNLTANGASRLTGITALAGGTANLTLNGGAVWTMPGNSSLATLSLGGGTVAMAAPAAGGPYKTLTIIGNLGGSGGTFNLSANPNAGLSDLISVGGTAGGNHRLSVRIVGGLPADLHRAVKVVDLVNEGAAHTAVFSGGADVGAYRYGVGRGSALTGYSGVGSLADYYLYNTLGPSAPATAAVGTAASASVAWYGEMNEIRKRLGELRLGGPSGDNFWARTYAGKHTVKPGGGQDFDQTLYGLELGRDNMKAVAGGKRYLGWVAGTGRADSAFGLGGSGRTDSYYLGAYASWLRDDGAYLDVVGKHNWFRHSFDTPVLGGGGDSGAYRNTGFGLSLEAGKRFEKGNGVFVEPQAELAALWTKGKKYTTANGLAVSAPAESSLQLRLGVAAGRKTVLKGGGSQQVYGKLSWVQELAGKTRTVVDEASFDSSLKGGRLVAGLGLVADTGRSQIYLDLETAWGKTVSKPWGVNLGCRWKL